MLERLDQPPADKILALMQEFRADPRPDKIDLGVGVYRTPEGVTPVMRAIRAAERQLWEAETTKTYTGVAGEPAFHAAMADLILGPDRPTDRLAAAARPLTIAGGPGWSQRAAEDLARFAECWDVPVAAAFRRQDYMDNRHPCYAGDVSVGLNPALGQRVRAADCLLVLGARLSDPVTDGYRLIDPAAPAPVLLQVHPDPDMIGRVYPAAVAIAAPAPAGEEASAPMSGKVASGRASGEGTPMFIIWFMRLMKSV
jgi:glyoxylate carboligase